MQPAKNSESDRTAEIKPAIRHTAPWRVIAVAALPECRLRVTFVDGTSGEVDMSRFLRNPNIDGTIFEPLRDPPAFSQAQVVMGVIQWPNGADLAPDAMYDSVRKGSVWVLE